MLLVRGPVNLEEASEIIVAKSKISQGKNFPETQGNFSWSRNNQATYYSLESVIDLVEVDKKWDRKDD